MVDDILQSDVQLLQGIDDDDEIELQDEGSDDGQLDQSEVIEVLYMIREKSVYSV
jgi:hypothetical protein